MVDCLGYIVHVIIKCISSAQLLAVLEYYYIGMGGLL